MGHRLLEKSSHNVVTQGLLPVKDPSFRRDTSRWVILGNAHLGALPDHSLWADPTVLMTVRQGAGCWKEERGQLLDKEQPITMSPELTHTWLVPASHVTKTKPMNCSQDKVKASLFLHRSSSGTKARRDE